MTDRTHEWRQLSADVVDSTPAQAAPPYQELARRVDNVEAALKAHDLELTNCELAVDLVNKALDHSHPELEKKIADVHETMAAVLKRAMQTRDITAKTAHDNLKAAFSELASRLDTVKLAHGAIATDIVEHREQLANLKVSVGALDSQVHAPREIVIPAEPVKHIPWLTLVALVLALVSIALHFVFLID